MNTTFEKKHKAILIISFITIILAAYFSVGSHHPDEYFQIIEFANYKMGGTTLQDLPWEFQNTMRPGVQPFIAFVFMKALSLLGTDNPFTIIFFLRLLTGILTWFITLRLIKHIQPKLTHSKSSKFLILSFLFLWFMPYLMVRFSSETWGGYSFLLGTILILGHLKLHNHYKVFFAGLLIIFSFYIRFQLGAAIFGLLRKCYVQSNIQVSRGVFIFPGHMMWNPKPCLLRRRPAARVAQCSAVQCSARVA
jgi:phosphatidylinositol glycan class B